VTPSKYATITTYKINFSLDGLHKNIVKIFLRNINNILKQEILRLRVMYQKLGLPGFSLETKLSNGISKVKEFHPL
jgi:hypothetical protein